MLVDALSASNEQIVQFAGHVASVSQVLADSSTHLDNTLGTLNQALIRRQRLPAQNNSTLIGTVNKLTDLTQMLSDQSEDIEQVLHVAGPRYRQLLQHLRPRAGHAERADVDPRVRQPGAVHLRRFVRDRRQVRPRPDYYRRAEICRERLGPVLRRLTCNYPPIMFHPLNMITAYKGQINYDTPETQAKSQTPIPELTWIPATGAHPPQPGGSAGADGSAGPHRRPSTWRAGPAAPARSAHGPGPAPADPGAGPPLPAEQGAGR